MAYLYRHIRLDKNVPFYIGIGNDNNGKYVRAFHGAKSRRCSRIWKRIVAKTPYEVEIVLDNLSWDEACQKEIEFIKIYGRIDKNTGTLANQTDGGEGVLGLIQSDESIRRSVEKRTGRKQTEEEKLKRSIAGKGRIISAETRAKMSKARKGNVVITDEHKEKIRQKLKGRKIPLDVIEKIKLTRSERTYVYVGVSPSEETRAKISAAHKGKQFRLGHKATFETREKLKNGCKIKKPVIQLSLAGDFIAEYGSQREAGVATGIPKESIGRACRRWGNYKTGQCGGYIWEHKTHINGNS